MTETFAGWSPGLSPVPRMAATSVVFTHELRRILRDD